MKVVIVVIIIIKAYIYIYSAPIIMQTTVVLDVKT